MTPKVKMPVSKKEAATKAPKFIPCEQQLFGGFDPWGSEPGRNPQGSNCIGGMRTYWAMTHDQNGNETGYERFASACRCLKLWRDANAAQTSTEDAPAPAAPRQAPAVQQSFADGKSRAAQ